jgi:hypothetical protein
MLWSDTKIVHVELIGGMDLDKDHGRRMERGRNGKREFGRGRAAGAHGTSGAGFVREQGRAKRRRGRVSSANGRRGIRPERRHYRKIKEPVRPATTRARGIVQVIELDSLAK